MFRSTCSHQHRSHRRHALSQGLLCLFFALSASPLHAQNIALHIPGTPESWIGAATAHEVSVIRSQDSFPLRYRLHKVDRKGEVVREEIDTPQGTVARTILRGGQPLTADEDRDERNRLQAILNNPDDWLKHERKNDSIRHYAMNLLQLMPKAMIYTYTPGQPQPANANGRQIVLDFHPNPHFHPPTTISQLLTGLEGRIWIDQRTQHLTQVQGRILHAVNFGWGVLARIYPGGTIEFEQTEVVPNHWVYSHVKEHLTIREMLFKTATEDADITAYDFRPLPQPVDVRQAVRELLAMQVPVR